MYKYIKLKAIVLSIERIREFLLAQFNDPVAQKELRSLGPNGVDWVKRTRHTLNTLIPRLPDLAKKITTTIPAKFNHSYHILKYLEEGRQHFDLIKKTHGGLYDWYTTLCEKAAIAPSLILQLESQQISAEIQRLIVSLDGLGDLVTKNGGSLYPDLVPVKETYDFLPQQSRTKAVSGPCLRGKLPSNIPDGCEIKTNRGDRIRVDAHGAHPGLHLGVTWDFKDDLVTVTGVWAGYIRIADHRECKRNVSVTTVKYSFGHNLFISLLT